MKTILTMPNPPKRQLQDEMLLAVLKEQLPEARSLRTVKSLITKVGKERYEDCCTGLFAYLEHACGTDLRRNEQLALLGQLFHCFTHYINRRMGLPTTVKTIFDTLYLLPHAVDEAYPGYAAIGILRAVITPKQLPIPLRKVG